MTVALSVEGPLLVAVKYLLVKSLVPALVSVLVAAHSSLKTVPKHIHQ